MQIAPLAYKGLPMMRVYNPDRDQMNDLVQKGEPFIITGCMNRWKLYQNLSARKNVLEQMEYVCELAPRRRILYSHLPPEQGGAFNFGKGLRQSFGFRRLQFGDFVRLVETARRNPTAGTFYMQAQPIPELMSQVGGLDAFTNFVAQQPPLFWMGSGGQSTALHNDSYRNIIAMFMGCKRVTLFPPNQLMNLYLAPIDRRVQGALTSLVTPPYTDFERFPRVRRAIAQVQVAIISPGEMLYIPPLWWHLVESFGINLALNCWKPDSPNASKLYEPSSLRLLSSAIGKETLNTRKALRDIFNRTLRGESLGATGWSFCEKEVISCALSDSRILEEILVGSVRNQWFEWVEAVSDWLIFQCEGNPFPTLAPGEFDHMVRRITSKAKIQQHQLTKSL